MNARKLASIFQFRFRTLLIAVALVGLGITALMNASSGWAHDLFFAAILILTLAIPLACYRTGQQRAFWAGFALFGWVYLLLLANIDERPRQEWSQAVAHGPSANVPTTRLTHWLYETAYGDPEEAETVNMAFDPEGNRLVLTTKYRVQKRYAESAAPAAAAASPPKPPWWHFLNVAHALWTMAIASIGGFVVRAICILRPEG